MSEIRSISEGTFVLGDTNNLTFEAGSGIKIDSPSEGTVRIANDETVLWSSGTPISGGVHDANVNMSLSEAVTNFSTVKFYTRVYDGTYGTYSNTITEVDLSSVTQYTSFGGNTLLPNGWWVIWSMTLEFANDKKSCFIQKIWQIWGDKSYPNSYDDYHTSNTPMYLYKVTGVNRISGGNA